jgi:hypothetical protein
MARLESLAVYAGQGAAERLREEGWHAGLFSLLVGASGGPKWFVLSQLDRYLFGDFLQRSTRPLSLLGSSIGAWRHACLAQPDPVAAVERMEEGYLNQYYAGKPDAAEVSAFSLGLLRSLFGESGARHLVEHPRLATHIVTARGRGPSGTPFKPALASGMGAAALGNAVSRRLLAWSFQRVVFHSGEGPAPGLALADFNTHFAPLREDNLAQALHATGSIPFVLAGERHISHAPAGHYWDGGIIDYHFDLRDYRGEGLILYPHFRNSLTAGWFDKFLPWRSSSLHGLDKLVLLCPSAAFVASLPYGKIPDRNDFLRLEHDQRVAYWRTVVARSQALAEEFAALVDGDDPLAGVTVLGRA